MTKRWENEASFFSRLTTEKYVRRPFGAWVGYGIAYRAYQKTGFGLRPGAVRVKSSEHRELPVGGSLVVQRRSFSLAPTVFSFGPFTCHVRLLSFSPLRFLVSERRPQPKEGSLARSPLPSRSPSTTQHP